MTRIIPWMCFATIDLWLGWPRNRVWSYLLGEAGSHAYWDDPWCVLNRRALAMERRTGVPFDPKLLSDLMGKRHESPASDHVRNSLPEAGEGLR